MSEKQKSQEKNVDYAYGVIDAIVEAMDRVAVKPEHAEIFVVDLLRKMPELIDALEIMTKAEHKPKMAELLRASARMVGAWIKRMAV